MPEVPYILSHSDTELRRLMLQAAILKPITERLLREAGLIEGMRVLDVGCGPAHGRLNQPGFPTFRSVVGMLRGETLPNAEP
jgi:hypothetical protein